MVQISLLHFLNIGFQAKGYISFISVEVAEIFANYAELTDFCRMALCSISWPVERYKKNHLHNPRVIFTLIAFPGWYEDNWFEVNLEKEGIECTVEQMRVAAEGHLTTEALMWNQNLNERTISGMTSEDFRHRLNDVLRREGYDIDNQRYPEGYQEAPLAYDAVWSVALGKEARFLSFWGLGSGRDFVEVRSSLLEGVITAKYIQIFLY